MGEFLFGEVFTAVDGIDNLERSIRVSVSQSGKDEVHECVGFVGESESDEGVKGEGGVSDPSESIGERLD